MWGHHHHHQGYPNNAAAAEYRSDMWINQNVPGGLNSPLGRQLDNYLGGNPNPTYGQMYRGGYGNPYGGGYRGW